MNNVNCIFFNFLGKYFPYLALTKGHRFIGYNFLHQEGSEISSITLCNVLTYQYSDMIIYIIVFISISI